MTPAEAIDATAEIALAATALYVAYNALAGWRKERKAARSASADDRQVAEIDARTHYLLAGLQRPWLWWLLVYGSTVKALLAAAALLQPLGAAFVNPA